MSSGFTFKCETDIRAHQVVHPLGATIIVDTRLDVRDSRLRANAWRDAVAWRSACPRAQSLQWTPGSISVVPKEWDPLVLCAARRAAIQARGW